MSKNAEVGSTEDQLFIQTLMSLADLETAAIAAYEQALEFIQIEAAFAEVASILDDHKRLRFEIAEVLKKYGITNGATDQRHDLLIVDMKRIEQESGNKGIFKALGYNEEVINRTYAAARKILHKHNTVMDDDRFDEERHLKTISRMIEQKIWDQQSELKGYTGTEE